MECSLSKTYALITAAIGMIAAAIAAASIFFNVPGLAIAIGLVIAVSGIPATDVGMIPQIRASLKEYESCQGPSQRCRLNPLVDLLGKAASLISAGAWIAALALQLAALGFLGSFFLSWLAPFSIAAGELLKWTGIASAAAAGAVLVGLMTQVRAYEACRSHERPEPSPIN